MYQVQCFQNNYWQQISKLVWPASEESYHKSITSNFDEAKECARAYIRRTGDTGIRIVNTNTLQIVWQGI